MFIMTLHEANAIDMTKDLLSLFWPIDICGPKVKQDILKNAEKDVRLYYVVLVILGIASLAMCPFWGDQREWVFCIQVYEYYCGQWAIIPYYIYCATAPWLAFSAIRINFIVVYAILQLRMQVFLINQHIAEISVVYEDVKKIENLEYQNKIFRKLRLCISHHVILKRWKRNNILFFC